MSCENSCNKEDNVRVSQELVTKAAREQTIDEHLDERINEYLDRIQKLRAMKERVRDHGLTFKSVTYVNDLMCW